MAYASRILSSTITRPNDTTAYAAGDLVANDTTAGNVTPFSWDLSGAASGCRVRQVNVIKSAAGVTNASFRVWLFNASKAVTNGDNGAIAPTTMASFIGSLTGSASLGGTAGAVCQCVADVGEIWPGKAGTLYALLEARGAYTPGAQETFQLELVLADESR